MKKTNIKKNGIQVSVTISEISKNKLDNLANSLKLTNSKIVDFVLKEIENEELLKLYTRHLNTLINTSMENKATEKNEKSFA